MQDKIKEILTAYGVIDNSRKVAKLSSDVEYRRLHFLLLSLILDQLKEIDNKLILTKGKEK